MTAKPFATWVEPIAAKDREVRAEFLAVARTLPADAWTNASPLPDWTYKDLLAHLAGDTGTWFRYILVTVLDGGRLDPKRVEDISNADALNAHDVEERRGRSVGELLAEFEAGGEERQALMSRLTDAHEHLRQGEYPMSFGEFLGSNPGGHVREHLAQLRTALEA